MKRIIVAICLALFVTWAIPSRGMPLLGHSQPLAAATSVGLGQWRGDPSEAFAGRPRVVFSGSQAEDGGTAGQGTLAQRPAASTASSRALDVRCAETGAQTADAGAATKRSVSILAEPATLAIWSFLGLLFGLRVWRRRKSHVAGASKQIAAAMHRPSWSDEQRDAIRETIERHCGRKPWWEDGDL